MEEQFVNSIVGHHSLFKGDIELDGLMRIDGDFIGSVKTSGKVLLGNQGRADCSIDARIVVIGGILKGTIYASDKVVLLASAVVLGNIYTPRLIAEEGVILEGSLMITGHRSDRASMDGLVEQPSGSFRLFKRRPVVKHRGPTEAEPSRPLPQSVMKD